MKKKRLIPLAPFKGFLFLSVFLFPFFISCRSADPEYTRCEEMCEYSRRDCIQLCGGNENFNFSFDFSGEGFETPYACTEKCGEKSEQCLSRCGDKSTPHE